MSNNELPVKSEHLMKIELSLDPPIDIGEVPGGYRRVIPIKSGKISGRINGHVIPGGADWNLVRPDGTVHVWARYTLQTDDGVNIMITNEGLQPGAAEVMGEILKGNLPDKEGYYCWGTPRFEVAGEKYAFLNEHIFLATLTPLGPLDIVLEFYEVTGR